MQRIYIDSNTTNRMRTKDSPVYENLANTISANSHEFFTLYSSAHTDDLLNDITDEKFEDAKYIEQLTNNFMLEYNAVHKKLNLFIKSPVQTLKEHEPTNFSFTNMFEGLGDTDSPVLKTLLKGLEDLFKTPAFDFKIDTTAIKNYENTYAKFIPFNEGRQSLSDLFVHFQALNEELSNKDSTLYKSTRKANIDTLKFNDNQNLSTSKEIDQVLIKSGLGKGIHEMIMQMGASDQTVTWHDYFQRGFIFLNMLALDKEKNRKANFTSLNNDSQHAYYSAHCDYLITEDKGLKFKAQVLFDINNISTKILTPAEFTQYIELRQSVPILSKDELIINLVKQMQMLKPFSEFKSEKFDRVTYYYNLGFPFFDYFNELEYIVDNDQGIFFVLLAKRSSFSVDLFYKEFELITNKIVEALGSDLENKSYYTEQDREELQNNTWQGRLWNIGKVPAALEINIGTKKISFAIGPVIPEMPQELINVEKNNA